MAAKNVELSSFSRREDSPNSGRSDRDPPDTDAGLCSWKEGEEEDVSHVWAQKDYSPLTIRLQQAIRFGPEFNVRIAADPVIAH